MRLEEFKISGPKVYMLLRDLLRQIAAKAERVQPEAPVPSHGDYKYNQFLFDGKNFGLIDVDRKTLEIVGNIQPAGIIGPGHEIATDSKGNLYTTETYEGKRVQKFVYKGIGTVAAGSQGVLWPK